MRILNPFNLGIFCRDRTLGGALRTASAEETFKTSRNVTIGMPNQTRIQFDSGSLFITLSSHSVHETSAMSSRLAASDDPNDSEQIHP